MPFFVLEKAQSGGSLRLPIDGAFDSREEALAALSAAVAAGEATVTGQVFVADLDSALPVLVMATPVAPAAQSPVEPDVTEDAVTVTDPVIAAPLVDEVADETGVFEAPEEARATEDVAVGIAGGSLVDALKRAASSLEDEGITAPESINADDFSFEEDLIGEEEVVVVAEDALADEADEGSGSEAQTGLLAPIGVAEPMSAQAEDAPEVLEAPADWPWANVEAFDESTGEEPEDTEEIEAPGAFDEPDTLITSAPPAGEDAYVPRPVILGDYTDMGDGDAGAEESPFDVVAADLKPVAAVESEMAYEPTGELDLAAYTCNDCVYANTCPKVGEVTPADCGAFQWRSS